MKKVSKAIKVFQSLNDDERLELEEFFKKEDDEEIEQKEEPKKEEKKQEEKEEPKKEIKEDEETAVEKLFKKMSEKIDNLEEQIVKKTAFGAKQKQQGGKESTEFDDLFASLRSQQRG